MVNVAAAFAATLSLSLSLSYGIPAAAGDPARLAPDSALTDTLNRWPSSASPATALPPAASPSATPAPSAASAPSAHPAPDTTRNIHDTHAEQERFLNTVTGSHQKADPPEWRARPPYPGAPLLLSLPVADFPYTLRGGFDSPSMRQSLMASAAFTQWADQSLVWLWSGAESGFLRNLLTYTSLGLFAWVSDYLPLGDAWLHEEWHRAVFTRRGIKSYNGIYDFDLGSSAIPVEHVEDRDLAALKDQHPAEFTRLMEAGGEGETEAAREMRRRNFFLGRQSYSDRIGWWVTGLNSSFYIWTSSIDVFDKDLQDENARETDPRQRDFTGLDYRAWVYDLRHPDVPYAAGPRGRLHPSGTGFDRYLLNGDLTGDERDFLKLQAGLSLLNLISGQNLGWDWLPGANPWGGQGYLWNFGLTHHLTPFGYAVGGEFLARQGKADWIFTAQGMANATLVLPCLGAELFRYPLALGREPVFLSLSLSAWLQPEAQRFRSRSAEPGGYGSLGAAFPLGQSLEIFAEGDAKTDGWEPGVVYLDAAAEGRFGIQMRL
ncbi:MAG: hypothetical protein JF616_05470 [Fibrobacteres bacterium]|nr:hypothetical protein [Fibrobacterota bacterium]